MELPVTNTGDTEISGDRLPADCRRIMALMLALAVNKCINYLLKSAVPFLYTGVILLSMISPTIAASDLDSKIATVLPSAKEDAWLNIGWHTNLMQARVLAQDEQRPMFLWVMNGHPLGCT